MLYSCNYGIVGTIMEFYSNKYDVKVNITKKKKITDKEKDSNIYSTETNNYTVYNFVLVFSNGKIFYFVK